MLDFLKTWISRGESSKLVRVDFANRKCNETLDLIAVDELGIVLLNDAIDDFTMHPWTAITSITVVSDWSALPLPDRVLEAQAKWYSN